jgi:hypothetical protein
MCDFRLTYVNHIYVLRFPVYESQKQKQTCMQAKMFAVLCWCVVIGPYNTFIGKLQEIQRLRIHLSLDLHVLYIMFLIRILRFDYSDKWKDYFTVYYIFGLNRTFLLSTNKQVTIKNRMISPFQLCLLQFAQVIVLFQG